MIKKNIAVLGCGYWGKNLVRNFSDLGALRTVCDTDTETLSTFQKTYSDINTCSDFHSVFADKAIQGVVIASPAVTHYPLAKAALQAGKDVFVEKPLALNISEGEELVELAEENSRILMVGHLLEYHPAVRRLKEIIERGELGQIYYLYSNRLNLGKFRTEENILWSFAPHDISVMLLLLKEMPQAISAHGGYYLHKDIADVTLTTFSFKSGADAHIFVNWLHPYKEQKLVVVGSKKMAVFNDREPKDKLILYDHEIEWIEHKPVPHQKQAQVIDVPLAEPLKLECQDFINSIKTRQKPTVDGRKGLQVLEVMSYCQKSLEEKGRVITPGNNHVQNYFVHPSSYIEQPSMIGDGTKIWHFCHVMPEVKIGKGCVLGQNVFIAKKVEIGNNVKIENNVSVFEGVTLEDDVFCGPSCVFTNVINPRSHVSRKHEFKLTRVSRGASIGANATIVCGNNIGQYAFIGAGAVVTTDVPDYAMVYGNPARIKDWVCNCGVKLDFAGKDITECSRCGMKYKKEENRNKVTVIP